MHDRYQATVQVVQLTQLAKIPLKLRRLAGSEPKKIVTLSKSWSTATAMFLFSQRKLRAN